MAPEQVAMIVEAIDNLRFAVGSGLIFIGAIIFLKG